MVTTSRRKMSPSKRKHASDVRRIATLIDKGVTVTDACGAVGRSTKFWYRYVQSMRPAFADAS